jgi:hypothetical protein
MYAVCCVILPLHSVTLIKIFLHRYDIMIQEIIKGSKASGNNLLEVHVGVEGKLFLVA